MSICCAFSFSLIFLLFFFFLLFCFPWDGVGEACAGGVTYFWRRSPEKLEFSSCSSFMSVVLCPLLVTDPSPSAPGTRYPGVHCIHEGCMLWFRMLCLFFFPSPTLVLLDLPQPSSAVPIHAHRMLSAWRSCVCVCLELFSYFSELRGRKRRGILHHFSKDYGKISAVDLLSHPLSSVQRSVPCCSVSLTL